MLYEAATAISSDLSLEFVLTTVAEQMTHALRSSGCALSLWIRERDQVETLVDYRLLSPELAEPAGTVYDLCDYPATRRVLETRQPAAIQHDDPNADEAELALMAEQEVPNMLMLPLVARDRVLGLAELVDEKGGREYSADEIRLAKSLATHAAIAIENAQLYDQSRKEIAERARAEEAIRNRSRELDLLNRVIMAATSTLDANHVLQVTCDALADAFDLPQAVAVLLNAEANECTIVAEYHDEGHPSRIGLAFPLAAVPLAESVLQHPQPLVVNNAQSDSRLAAVRDLVREAGTRSLLVVPIVLARGRVAGAIVLTRSAQPDFSARERAVAQNVAAAAGQALETARLYEALRRNVESLEETVALRTFELGIALERAKDADRVKSEFVSNVSHELRTPLTSLKLYLSLLAHDQSEKRQTYLDILCRETDRLQHLIEALLDISRLDLGKTRVDLQPTDLNQIVSVLAVDRSALASDRGLTLEVELVDDLPLVDADPKLLQQVLTNLLTNAINYTPTGGRIILFTADATTKCGEWIAAGVSDTGPGIPAEERDRLFERFFRGSAGRASDAPGTGLGLAICKQIMDLHQGEILLQSDGVPGHGSTFTIRLPRPSSVSS
jgi:signal transduction histidine kinase